MQRADSKDRYAIVSLPSLRNTILRVDNPAKYGQNRRTEKDIEGKTK